MPKRSSSISKASSKAKSAVKPTNEPELDSKNAEKMDEDLLILSDSEEGGIPERKRLRKKSTTLSLSSDSDFETTAEKDEEIWIDDEEVQEVIQKDKGKAVGRKGSSAKKKTGKTAPSSAKTAPSSASVDTNLVEDDMEADKPASSTKRRKSVNMMEVGPSAGDASVNARKRRRQGEIDAGYDLEDLIDQEEDLDEEDGTEEYSDFSWLNLRPDHHKRQVWVVPDGRIFMETFGANYREVYDFLISIAHPLARTRLMHQYRINHGSLYAATSLGLEKDHILQQLDRFSKNELPQTVIDYVTTYTERFGKATLVLKNGHYFIESYQQNVLKQLKSDPEILKASLGDIIESIEDVGDSELAFPTEMDVEEVTRQMDRMRNVSLSQNKVSVDPMAFDGIKSGEKDGLEDDKVEETETQDENDAKVDETIEKRIYSFEIDGRMFETVKRRCIEMDYPLLEEYDFSNDTKSETIQISLKPTTVLRRYQEKCLSKLFAHGRVKSGIISLACGAGKSLVGVVASSTTKKKTLVLCTSTVSVQQWIHQFLLWSNIHHHNVVAFTSGGGSSSRGKIMSSADLGSVLVTTYNMLSHSNKRSGYSAHVVGLIEQEEWGLVILDETHVVPANTFRSVISKVKSHCKLGLSATLVREDDLIEHLLYLIGPKLYEANWIDLCRAGHIANVCCAEVWCPMTAEFYKEYVVAESRRARALYIMNPNKLRTCEHLIRFHEARNDKILVFSDDVFALKTYANLLGKPYIYGSTPNAERVQLLSAFQYNSNAKTLFISKIGDNSIDLPEATVLIQISSHYGSRRQEAQRLGRILRPKSRTLSSRSFDAFFYSLVSQDTKESYYSAKRQQFLIEQGYAFKIFKPMHDKPGITVMNSKDAQITLLRKVLAADIDTLREMEDELDERRLQDLFSLLNQSSTASTSTNVPETQSSSTQATQATPASQIAPSQYAHSRSVASASLFSGGVGLEYDEIIDDD